MGASILSRIEGVAGYKLNMLRIQVQLALFYNLTQH